MTIKTLIEKVWTRLNEEHIYPEYVDEFAHNVFKVGICWGDWKHEHLRADWIIREYLELMGLEVVMTREIPTEEDGSDTYSADHYIFVKGLE